MALVPVNEEAVFHELVQPGSVYDDVSGKYIFNGNDDEVTKVLKFHVEYLTGELLQQMRNSVYAKNNYWMQDLGTVSSQNIISVKVNKICVRTAKNVQFSGKPVITSVKNRCDSKLVLFFSQAVDVKMASYIRNILEEALYTGGSLNVPENFDTNFLFAHLYKDYTNPCTTKTTTLKTSLEMFCEHMLNISVHKHVPIVTILKGYTVVDEPEIKKMSEPREKTMTHNEQTYNKQREKTMTHNEQRYNKPREKTITHNEERYNEPREKTMTYNEPREKTMTYNEPREKTMTYNEPRENTMTYNEPSVHIPKPVDYLTDQKHKARGCFAGECNTSSKDLLSFVGDLGEHNVPSTGADDKVLNAHSHSDEQNIAKAMQCQLSTNDDLGMRHFHGGEKVICDQGHHRRAGSSHEEENVIRDEGYHRHAGSRTEYSVEDEQLSNSSSNTSGVQQLHNKTGDAKDAMCNLYSNDIFQGNEQLSQQTLGKTTSCKGSVSSVQHPLTQHSPVETEEKYVEFCSMEPVKCDTESSGLCRKYFGMKNSSVEEKVIILIGREGSGKTELIDSAANYFKGTEAEDSKLYTVTRNLVNEQLHTCSVTAYTFCCAGDDSPITIIDTPELRDVKETEKNPPLQTLKTFLTRKDNNIKIHAFGFVIPFHVVCLNSTERHLIDFITANFGKDISSNFITFVTFAGDAQKTYPVTDIFRDLGIKPKMFFKFNNSAFSTRKTMMDAFYKAYWKMDMKKWRKCVKVLRELPPLIFKSLRAKQEKIYSTCLMKSVETQLRNELKTFILLLNEGNVLTQSMQDTSEQVWRSAAALSHLKSSSDGSSSHVESVLVEYVEEVARENSFPPKKCVMLLSLCPSQGLLEAGKRVIEFMKPTFDKAKACEPGRTAIRKGPEHLFCKKCKKRHEIQRRESKNSSSITYRCLNCNCNEDCHVWCKPQGKPQKTCELHSHYCVQHTRDAIEKILKEYSIPGHVLNIKEYLQFISYNVDEEYKDFIHALNS